MSDPFVAEIKIFTCSYTPYTWADCNGQLTNVFQNGALFALISSHFGGDGKNTFALPDLQCRVVIGDGQGPGLHPYNWGIYGGNNSVTIQTFSQLPSHNHTPQVSAIPSTQDDATGNYLSSMREMISPTPVSQKIYYEPNTFSPDLLSPMDPTTLTSTFSGSPTPHENRQPFLALRFCIALEGIFPTRS